jgi:ATP-dependent Clp protease protease subunit
MAAGTKGKRYSLPHSRIMLHQPSGAIGGTSKDIEIQAREVLHYKKILAGLFADLTGQSLEKVIEDSERDFYLSALEAKDYGLIDNVIQPKMPQQQPAFQKG